MCCWVVCFHTALYPTYIFLCDSKIVVLKYLTRHGSVRNFCQIWLNFFVEKGKKPCLVIPGEYFFEQKPNLPESKA